MAFTTLPTKATLKPTPFAPHVSDEELDDFKTLLRISKIGPKTYENLAADTKDMNGFGITRDWLDETKQHWLDSYDWRKTEARIASFPNYKVGIDHDGTELDVHFAAFFSKKQDAVPIILLHGWPGSFLEFLGVLDVLKGKYDEDSLPYHVVVPSLPGYGYSSGPPLDKDFGVPDAAAMMDKLMVGLGFGSGYLAQGGDIGSYVSRVLNGISESCKALHLNFSPLPPPTDEAIKSDVTTEEQQSLQRASAFEKMGLSYASEHGTRPATIGLVLSSSPIALLAWIGEKFIQWSDVTPPLDEILDSVTLYWFTESFPRSIYPYRHVFGTKPISFHSNKKYQTQKPLGFSWNPKEILPMPASWVAASGNMTWHKRHSNGGHFAAMEKPDAFTQDIEDFVAEAWSKSKSQL
ncbi:alpha/beta-hydrolase [Polychaeton citri CBS 116435]|uniref:Alpha/beta-hydrolase n=1 Tax=Polychaeton citri CBS 116435 TaxID=1314669 RepID=A0A9P4URN4_9PEZI|nr:alpha/beta-hydrolase [Polychaeton citri CBS 116435]